MRAWPEKSSAGYRSSGRRFVLSMFVVIVVLKLKDLVFVISICLVPGMLFKGYSEF